MRQRLLLLCICIGSYLFGIAQPANDPCSGAIAITNLDGTCTTALDITNATPDIAASACTAGSNENVWFSFVATGVSLEVVVTSGVGVPEITVWRFTSGPCNSAGASEIGCIAGNTLVLDNDLIIGQTYYVMVAFSNNQDGSFDICLDNPQPAPNDACVNATPITSLDGACITYDNDFPSTDVLTPGCFTGSTYNVWYSFVAQGVSLDAHIEAGGPGVAQLAVVDFATNCDATGAVVLGCATGTNSVILDNDLVIGQTYHIVVGFANSSFSAGVGDFELCVDNPEPAPNDECDDAINIPAFVLSDDETCYTTISGNDLNNDWPSTDIGTGPCWDPNFTYNIWYSFVAQGNDVQITIDPVFPETAQISLVDFTGTVCEFAGAVSLACNVGTVLDYNDLLVIGETYYIMIGFEDNAVGDFCMNVFNPVPPPNDDPCMAIVLPTNGNCVDGTTIYANPEGYNVPPDCLNSFDNTVWYTVNMQDPDNVAFEVDIDLEDTPPGSTVSLILWEITDCNQPGPIAFFYCGPQPNDPIEWGPIDDDFTYYLQVSTSEPNETEFEICVDEIPPCFPNDTCESATIIDNVVSDAAFVCVPGCSLFAEPESFNNQCGIGDFGTVWFQVPTDGNATLMNIQVTSDDFDAPTISLFHAVPDCNNLQPIGLTQSNLTCIVGSNGEAEALATDVGASEIYYIAVSSVNSVGGEFELCVNTISQASACVVSRDIEITSRSFGGPLEGPFLPGEVIGVCMNVNSYTAAGNGCQWFQGLVPVFGNGWDPSSFDGNGQPLGATINGNPMGQAGNGNYGTSIWDWFTGVGYHHTNIFFQVGDIDGNGTTDMCNILYDPDCPDLGGITGGCCGPCWANAGDPLPPGWFAYGINGTCGTPGPPISVDWGDGNTCGGGMGPWNFCFDLMVREYPDCLEDPTTMDLSLGFFTFADGEVGSWTGSASICALDQPAKITLPMCCTELATDEEELDPICSGNQIVYVIDKPDVDYWQWTVNPGSVTGGTNGEGGPGSIIINTLVNNGSGPEIVEYTFLGFAGGACPVFEHTVTVEVFPEIEATIPPYIMCATPLEPYIIEPTVEGGSENYSYVWAPNGETTSTISVANPVNGTQYVVTVTDDVGCSATASVVINVYTTFPVDILAPIVEQCLQDGEIDLGASVTGGMDPYDFLWTFPDNTTETTDQISSGLSGQHHLLVTDEEGCSGQDSVTLILNEEPEVTIDAVDGVTAICAGESTTLNGIASGGETPYAYDWETPDGIETGKTIEAFTPGIYTVTVTDNNGCTASFDIAIDEQPTPEPDLGPTIYACPDFSDPITLEVAQNFEDYQWSVGAWADGMQSIDVYEPGLYTVTVTNVEGCRGEADVLIDLFDEPVFVMPDIFEICPGNSVTIDLDDFGGPWDAFDWPHCNLCQNIAVIDEPGTYDPVVFDENGCSATQSFDVVESATLSPNLQGDNVICAGETITLTTTPGFTSYTWSPNLGSGNSINVTAPGEYSVTVADALGCTGTDTIEIVSGDFTAAITGPDEICAGVLAPLNAGGPYASYLWSNGMSTQMVSVDDGSYSVTVTNSDGCSSVASITVIETPFVPQITGDNLICQTSETSVLDAGGPYSVYQWSANAGSATTQTVTVSAPGVYSVTITDLATCVGEASFTVDNHPVPFVSVTGNPDFCVGGSTDLSATPGYVQYAWNTTGTTELITVNTAGNYVVTITDANGCTNTANLTVNPPFQETVQITGSTTFCPGDQATLEVASGYASVLWSTSETTDQISVSTQGEVSVIVVDADGCIAYDTVVTVASSTLTPEITGDAAICDAGTANLNAGAGYETYLWSTGDVTQTIAVNAANTYSVTVTTGSCSGEDDFVVTSSSSPFANVTSTATACNVNEPGGPGTTVNLTTLVTGGDTGGSWVQTSGPSSVVISATLDFDGLAPGDYVFTYTTNSAIDPCVEASYPLTITVSDCACPLVDIGLAPDLCNDLGTLALNTILDPQSVTGGVWTIISDPGGSNPATITAGNIFDASTADEGTYTLQYTVSGLPNYCQNSVTTTINVLRTPVAGSAAEPAVFCQGEVQTVSLSTLLIGSDNGGQWVETSITPSTSFNPGNGTLIITNEAAGTYTFNYVVTGPGPCPDDVVTVEVVIEANPVADAGVSATLDCNQTSTTLGGSGSSTGPDFTYSWTTTDGSVSNANQLNATASAAGTYVLTVMNIQTGCSATDEVVIDQVGDFPTDMELLVQSPDCEGDPPGSMQVSFVTGGVEPYLYSLNGAPPVPSPVFNNLPAGDYEIEVTDATGCKLTETFTIEELVTVDLSIVNYVNDTFVFALGDTITLTFLYSGSSDTPDSLVWKLGDSVLCINCPVLEMVADLAGKITLEAYDVRGCFISKSINFIVVRKRDIYVPNVFSPNGDGVNDYFTLFTDADIKEISLLEVYTRWGDLVFKKEHFNPNIPEDGWDGKFKGETLNPGVYVYRMEVIYGDDLEENLAGDITIIR